jgi:cytochrome P450
MPGERSSLFPLGAAVTVAGLDGDPHPVLRGLRAREPVSWLPALGGWLVTRHDLALRVMNDSGVFTVDDPRFSTAQVVGPSMLSTDGAEHQRHRDPFSRAFRGAPAVARLETLVTGLAVGLVSGLRTGPGAAAPGETGRPVAEPGAAEPGAVGRAELRRGLAGPLAVAVVADILGLTGTEPAVILSWYDAIVGAVTELSAQPGAQAPGSAGEAAFAALRASLLAAAAQPGAPSLLATAARDSGLAPDEVVSNAAVLMFGGIETTEGMICTAVWHLLSDPAQLSEVRADPALLSGAVAESLRLEPAAAVVDRYATADVLLGGAGIRRGDLVTVSITAANRDPAVFPDPDRFDIRRHSARHNLGFARGPHFCPGAELARLETRAAISALLDQLPGLRLDPARLSPPQGLVFRKPPSLHVQWDTDHATPSAQRRRGTVTGGGGGMMGS